MEFELLQFARGKLLSIGVYVLNFCCILEAWGVNVYVKKHSGKDRLFHRIFCVIFVYDVRMNKKCVTINNH